VVDKGWEHWVAVDDQGLIDLQGLDSRLVVDLQENRLRSVRVDLAGKVVPVDFNGSVFWLRVLPDFDSELNGEPWEELEFVRLIPGIRVVDFHDGYDILRHSDFRLSPIDTFGFC
jgi:hypothetical protein